MIRMRYHAEIIMNTYDADFIQLFLKEKAITGKLFFLKSKATFRRNQRAL